MAQTHTDFRLTRWPGPIWIFDNLALNSLNQSNFNDVLLESEEELRARDPAHAVDCSPGDLVVQFLNWN
jgi:hypothetical protein